MSEFKAPQNPKFLPGSRVNVLEAGGTYTNYERAARAMKLDIGWCKGASARCDADYIVLTSTLHPDVCHGTEQVELVAIMDSSMSVFIVGAHDLGLAKHVEDPVFALQVKEDPVGAVMKLITEVQDLRKLVAQYRDERDAALERLTKVREALALASHPMWGQ